MKRFVFLLALILTTFVITGSSKNGEKAVTLTARVLEIKKGGMSGSLLCYHNIKYQVLSVCDGEESDSEILVAYLSMSGEEVDDLNVGDVVCMKVLRTNEFKENIEKLREDSKLFGFEFDISEYKIPMHLGYSYIKNCQCYLNN